MHIDERWAHPHGISFKSAFNLDTAQAMTTKQPHPERPSCLHLLIVGTCLQKKWFNL